MYRWDRRRNQLKDEIQTHIDLETQENIQAGMPPEEARHAAMKKFGNALLAMDKSREIWGGLGLEHLLQDLRYALRGLRKSPGYTASVVLTLALGFGSVATMLAIVDSVLLRPVSLPHPHQIVMIYGKTQQPGAWRVLSYDQIETLRRDSHSFSGVAGYAFTSKPVGTQDGTRSAMLAAVTPGFFHMLGVPPKMGRLLNEGDTARPVVLVSYDFWQERLHDNPHVLGSTIRLSGTMRTIVGVLPRGLEFPLGADGPVVYAPISPQKKGQGLLPGGGTLAIARLKPGVSIAQGLAETRSLLTHYHDPNGVKSGRLTMESVTYFLTGSLEQPLLALLGGVGILLLIACANAANLQITRATERLHEMQVRSALGASFARLVQQLLVESLVVSLAGAALGAVLAVAAIAAIRSAYAGRFSRFNEIAVHPAVLAGMAVLAIVAGILASLAPAWSLRRRTVGATGAQPTTTPRNRVSGVLVAFQIALTCVLLVTCGLFVRTFRALQQVPLGFDPHHVTTLVLMPEDSNQPPALFRQIDTRLLERFQALPGVEAAAMQTSIPFANFISIRTSTTYVSGRPFHKGDSASYSIVSSNFVRASGIHLLQGRGFQRQDDGSAAMVALVNQAFAEKFLPGRNPLGITLRTDRDPGEKKSDVLLAKTLTIVGVVQNEMQTQDIGSAFEPMVYVDDLQIPKDSALLDSFGMMSQFAIRSPLPQDVLDKEIRATLKQVAPEMAEIQLTPMEQGIEKSLGERRLALRLVSSFGAMALLLAAIGIYGMLAYAVTLRRREIGVRMALGSSRLGVTRLVLRQAGRMVLIGIIPGLAGAWAAGHAVRSFLFGVKPMDAVSLAAAVVVLLLTGAIAAIIPALRAAQVDPMEALRVE